MLEKIIKIPDKLFRYTIIPKFNRILRKFKKRNNNTPLEKEFIRRLSRYKKKWLPANRNIVLTQIMQDHSMCIKLSAAASFIAGKYASNIGLYPVITNLEDKNYNSKTIFADAGYRRLDNLYLSFGGKVVHRHVYEYADKKLINFFLKKIRGGILEKEDVLNVSVEGIFIGDLIYDTYLRNKNSPTLNVQDELLDKVILEALNIYFNCKELFSRYNVKALVNSYTTYIHHGIIVRLCLSKNIPVYTIGSEYSLVHKVLNEYPSHHNNHILFNALFNRLENKSERINESKNIFEKRFKGQIDSATSYMKESAFSDYTNPELDKLDGSNTVVVLAHCFFDAPHSYIKFLFPDFYEWMIFTLDELLRQKNITVLVKQHPNGVKANDEIFDQLKIKYKNTNIKFIDKKTSQLQLLKLRPKAIITGYGTAASEFAYHGIPVLMVYDNPFTSYNFTLVAKTIDQYNKLLSNLDDIKIPQNRNEILEYYYMQHIFFRSGREADYLKFEKYKENTFSDEFLNDFLPLMDEAYFEMLDSSIKDGFDLVEFESKLKNI